MIEPIEITVDDLYRKIGLLVAENDALRRQLVEVQTVEAGKADSDAEAKTRPR